MSARQDYPKAHANTSGPDHQGETSRQTQDALDEIDRLRKINHELVCRANDMNLLSVLQPDNERQIHERWKASQDRTVDDLEARVAALEARFVGAQHTLVEQRPHHTSRQVWQEGKNE